MDKRTLLFVLSLSLTLFLVNTYFEQGRQESLKEWHEQQKAKKFQKKKALEATIAERTAKPRDLPLVKLYADVRNTQYLTSAVRIKNSIFTLSWQKEIPQSLYVNGELFTLAYSPNEVNAPVLYEKQTEDVLSIGNLPFFGHYDLQLITLYPGKPQKSPTITLGDYTDGHFSIPLLELDKISEELGEEIPSEWKTLPGNALVLMHTEEEYLPVAVYKPENKSLTYLEQISDLSTDIVLPQVAAADQVTDEKYYVLENGYQQLVLSNRGGAVVEINLPFESESHPNSVVREIEFDRIIVEDHPYNARFPSKSFFSPGNSPKGPFVEHTKGKLGGYYPLLRRDLIKKSGKKSIKVLPEYYTLNIVSEFPEMAELSYDVTSFDKFN